jgi:hypothetical protein
MEKKFESRLDEGRISGPVFQRSIGHQRQFSAVLKSDGMVEFTTQFGNGSKSHFSVPLHLFFVIMTKKRWKGNRKVVEWNGIELHLFNNMGWVLVSVSDEQSKSWFPGTDGSFLRDMADLITSYPAMVREVLALMKGASELVK